MKLSKSERHTAYIIMLAMCEKNIEHLKTDSYLNIFMPWGFCEMCGYELTNGELHLEDLPELLEKGPSDHGSYWFPKNDIGGWYERIKILNKCIEETYNF